MSSILQADSRSGHSIADEKCQVDHCRKKHVRPFNSSVHHVTEEEPC